LEIRAKLDQLPDSDSFDPSNITAGKARTLMERYHLH
jgi:hypothetical protein